MSKLTLIIILLLSFFVSYSQQNILIFKKGNKTTNRFWKGSFIAFQLHNNDWQKGEITRISNDSFYIRPRVIRYYLMNSDTSYYPVIGFSLSDVSAIPKKGILIDFINGRFQISTTGGHLHWYWIKSGWIFRVGAAGYAGLHIANGIINDNSTFRASNLGIAAAVFLGGVLLHRSYKPILKIGKKYHLEVYKLSN